MPRAEAPEQDRALAGLGVLVTRPAGQAEPLCRLIEAAGGHAIRFPLLAIEPLPAVALAWEDYDLALFVSRNAVELAAQAYPPPPEGVMLAAVGKGTAAALEQQWGRAPLRPDAGFDSEALLAHTNLRQVDGKRILILRGEGGRELLADTLRERGATVEYRELYRRTAPPLDGQLPLQAVAAGELQLLLITSGEALQHLSALYGGQVPQALGELPLLVVSERLAALAREQGFQTVRVAPEPGDAGLLAGLKEWAPTRH